MYNCLIVDDKLLQRDVIAMHLQKIPQLNIAAVCTNGIEAHQVLMKESIDIVFSDINMPELNGLELRRSLKNSPVFIFISDYPEHAAESYELDVIDYILKPVSFERLLKAATKAIEYLEAKQKPVNDRPVPQGGEDYFFIKETSDIIKLRFDEVAYIESTGNFSKIYMLSGKYHMALVILKNLESQLPVSVFTRVHKQYIINHRHLSSIGTSEITIAGKFDIPLSQSYRGAIIEKLVQDKMIHRNIP